MATLSVVIDGPSVEAKFTLDKKAKALTKSGKKYSGSFKCSKGSHKYSVTVSGGPNEQWTATVETDCESHQHEGKMSANGRDTSGTRTIEACS